MSTNRSMGGFLGAVVGACLGSPYIFMKSGDISRDDAGWRLSAPGIEMELAFAGMRSFARHGVDMDALARAYSSVIRDGVHDLDVVSATILAKMRPWPRSYAVGHRNRSLGRCAAMRC